MAVGGGEWAFPEELPDRLRPWKLARVSSLISGGASLAHPSKQIQISLASGLAPREEDGEVRCLLSRSGGPPGMEPGGWVASRLSCRCRLRGIPSSDTGPRAAVGPQSPFSALAWPEAVELQFSAESRPGLQTDQHRGAGRQACGEAIDQSPEHGFEQGWGHSSTAEAGILDLQLQD